MIPFAREVRGLLGRMDTGLSYNEYSSKVGDLAAAYAGIDRSDRSALNSMIVDAADKAYEAFKDGREPWLYHIQHPKSDFGKDRFDTAFSRAAQKGKMFLLLFETEKHEGT